MRRRFRFATILTVGLAVAVATGFTSAAQSSSVDSTTATSRVGPDDIGPQQAWCNGYILLGRLGGVIQVPAANSSANCIMGQGAQSSGVKALQRALRSCEGANLGSGGVDGIYGPATARAVRDFQQDLRDRGIPVSVDGVYGPETRNNLRFYPSCSRF